MANKETGLTVFTDKLGQFAKDVVDAKVLEGQCKGKTGWEYVPENQLLDQIQSAIWNKDYATMMVYATMLQARVYNGPMQETAPLPLQPIHPASFIDMPPEE